MTCNLGEAAYLNRVGRLDLYQRSRAQWQSAVPLAIRPETRNPMRVLVIEDDRETAAFIQKSLKESGHAADLAHDGETGLVDGAGGTLRRADRRPHAAEDGWTDDRAHAARRRPPHAGAVSLGAGRRRRPGQGPARRRRRLPDQAVCLYGALGAHRVLGAALGAGRAGDALHGRAISCSTGCRIG